MGRTRLGTSWTTHRRRWVPCQSPGRTKQKKNAVVHWERIWKKKHNFLLCFADVDVTFVTFRCNSPMIPEWLPGDISTPHSPSAGSTNWYLQLPTEYIYYESIVSWLKLLFHNTGFRLPSSPKTRSGNHPGAVARFARFVSVHKWKSTTVKCENWDVATYVKFSASAK